MDKSPFEGFDFIDDNHNLATESESYSASTELIDDSFFDAVIDIINENGGLGINNNFSQIEQFPINRNGWRYENADYCVPIDPQTLNVLEIPSQQQGTQNGCAANSFERNIMRFTNAQENQYDNRDANTSSIGYLADINMSDELIGDIDLTNYIRGQQILLNTGVNNCAEVYINEQQCQDTGESFNITFDKDMNAILSSNSTVTNNNNLISNDGIATTGNAQATKDQTLYYITVPIDPEGNANFNAISCDFITSILSKTGHTNQVTVPPDSEAQFVNTPIIIDCEQEDRDDCMNAHPLARSRQDLRNYFENNSDIFMQAPLEGTESCLHLPLNTMYSSVNGMTAKNLQELELLLNQPLSKKQRKYDAKPQKTSFSATSISDSLTQHPKQKAVDAATKVTKIPKLSTRIIAARAPRQNASKRGFPKPKVEKKRTTKITGKGVPNGTKKTNLNSFLFPHLEMPKQQQLIRMYPFKCRKLVESPPQKQTTNTAKEVPSQLTEAVCPPNMVKSQKIYKQETANEDCLTQTIEENSVPASSDSPLDLQLRGPFTATITTSYDDYPEENDPRLDAIFKAKKKRMGAPVVRVEDDSVVELKKDQITSVICQNDIASTIQKVPPFHIEESILLYDGSLTAFMSIRDGVLASKRRFVSHYETESDDSDYEQLIEKTYRSSFKTELQNAKSFRCPKCMRQLMCRRSLIIHAKHCIVPTLSMIPKHAAGFVNDSIKTIKTKVYDSKATKTKSNLLPLKKTKIVKIKKTSDEKTKEFFKQSQKEIHEDPRRHKKLIRN